MSRKRLRTSSESTNSELKSVFRIERAPKPLITGSKRTTIDDEKVYLSSDPPGKDYKESMLSLNSLTNMLCPKLSYKIKHYGIDFAGGHRNAAANQPGGGGIASTGNWTDARNFRTKGMWATDDGRAFADTIFWTAGTQGWYESLSLPGTWDAGGFTLEDGFEQQPSLTGLINGAYSAMTHFRNSSDGLDQPNQNETKDFMIHYNGGSQTHTFVNQNEHEIYYEIWELIPRNIETDWIHYLGTNSLINEFEFRNIHTQIAYSYVHDKPVNGSNTNTSAVNNIGTYDTGTGINEKGQKIQNKNDPGFRINKNCLDLYHRFRVSQSRKGSLKSGSVLKYEMKHGPFVIRNSVWNRWVNKRPSSQHMGDEQDYLTDNYKAHLIPCATKILCCRFWSELGNKNDGWDDGSGTSKDNFRVVTNVQGRLLHTVTEKHTIRAMPYVKQHQNIIKDFTHLNYKTENGENFQIINDAQDTQMTTAE